MTRQYAVFRNIHLVAGLFAAAFLLAYGLSAAQMAYPIYQPARTTSARMVAVPANVDASPRPLARWLADRHDVRGDLTDIHDEDGTVTLTIARPGTVHRVEYRQAGRQAEISTEVSNAVGMLNRLHHVRGVTHDYWAINAWAWFLCAASLALLLLAATGVVMWFQRHADRRVGALVLGVGLFWGLTCLILVRLA